MAPIAWVAWGFMGLAFWILLGALIVLLVRGTRPSAHDSGAPAIRMLEERYARGEMTREDFLDRRGVLRGGSPRAAGDDPQ